MLIEKNIVDGWKNVAGVTKPEVLDGVDCAKLRESLVKYLEGKDLESLTRRTIFSALETELNLEPKKLSSGNLREFCRQLIEKALLGGDVKDVKAQPSSPVPTNANDKKRKQDVKPTSAPKKVKSEPESTGLSATRKKAVDVFVEALNVEPRESEKDVDRLALALQLEQAIYDKVGTEASKDWAVKVRSLKFNLADSRNPLRYLVLRGEVSVTQLIEMKPEELASDEKKQELKELYEKAKFATQTSDRFKCSNCGQRRTTYYQLQTRSADEPMTVFVTCVNCGRRWKFS